MKLYIVFTYPNAYPNTYLISDFFDANLKKEESNFSITFDDEESYIEFKINIHNEIKHNLIFNDIDFSLTCNDINVKCFAAKVDNNIISVGIKIAGQNFILPIKNSSLGCATIGKILLSIKLICKANILTSEQGKFLHRFKDMTVYTVRFEGDSICMINSKVSKALSCKDNYTFNVIPIKEDNEHDDKFVISKNNNFISDEEVIVEVSHLDSKDAVFFDAE